MYRVLILVFGALIYMPLAYGDAAPKGAVDPDIYVDVYKPGKTWHGTTLLADYHNPNRPRIIEVNMLGEIVWEYLIPENLRQYTNPGFDVELLPNNNILFVLPRKGVYEVSRNGSVVWSYLDEKVSHDADRLPNGNTLVVWGEDEIGDAQVKEVNPEGRVVWAWYAKDHFYKSPYKDIYRQGWTHTNAVTRLPNGNTLISLRNFQLTVEVDPQGSVVWSFNWGSLGRHPHEPQVLPNGNLLIALRGPHRVVEIDRQTGAILWQFEKPTVKTIRDADRLPNGNTLIVERTKVLEVTSAGEVVWLLRVKGVTGEKRDKPRWLYKAERIGTAAPRISIASPQSRTYESGEVEVIIDYLGADLDTIWYRVYDRSRDRWATEELTYVRNKWRDAITFDGAETGFRKITLDDGDYTLYVWANSTGWGDENLLQRKVVNTANTSVDFSILAKPAVVTPAATPPPSRGACGPAAVLLLALLPMVLYNLDRFL
jgi:phage terminase large subunit-like protein